MVYLGWIREGWQHWFHPEEAEGTTIARADGALHRWIDENHYRDHAGDGETVVLLAGTPPWLPMEKKS